MDDEKDLPERTSLFDYALRITFYFSLFMKPVLFEHFLQGVAKPRNAFADVVR
jgi:hypothetical protein